ncbi:hypothetical protein AC579_3902 [Pseudocercospora musae]|uniref:Uncharacterized protein n=1 Tax=Pseudocercospora musae TaxID=113226 RepID=A0A139I335_9PEZI|nr:hypothetical protein AC579_3902 [Pseudocercospora musae]
MLQGSFAIMSLIGIARDKLTRKSHARNKSRAGSSGKARCTESVSRAENNHEFGSNHQVECVAITQDAGHTPMPSPTCHSSPSKPKIVMSGRPASAGYFHSSLIPEDREDSQDIQKLAIPDHELPRSIVRAGIVGLIPASELLPFVSLVIGYALSEEH